MTDPIAHLLRLAELGRDVRFGGRLDTILGAMRPIKIACWLTRVTGGGTNLSVVAVGETCPTDLDGFEDLGESTFELGARSDPSGHFLVFAADRALEWYSALPAASRTEAHAWLLKLPWLTPFAPLGAPDASVNAVGVEWSLSEGTRALVKIARSLSRLGDDEDELRRKGFTVTDDPSIWSAPSGHSLVFMGGTLYGYFGRVPDEIGDFG